MLCDISQVGVRYDCDSLYPLVMIANEAKLVDHRAKTLPSGKRRGFDDETGKTAGCLDVRVDRLREFSQSRPARSQNMTLAFAIALGEVLKSQRHWLKDFTTTAPPGI